MTPDIEQRRPSPGGFTLIEVMIASALLSFEILAVIAMFGVAAKSSTFSRRLTTASSIAHNLLEKAKNTDYDNLVDLRTVDEATGAVCFDREMTQTACTGSAAIFRRIVRVSTDTPVIGMTQVFVQVTWTDESGIDHRTSMATGVSKF